MKLHTNLNTYGQTYIIKYVLLDFYQVFCLGSLFARLIVRYWKPFNKFEELLTIL